MTRARVIALGNPHASDDGAALAAIACLDPGGIEIVRAGRPGVALIDLLDHSGPVVLVDVIHSGREPGSVVRCPLAGAVDAAAAATSVSCHDFGPAEALKLARALGRTIPPGWLVGIEGAHFAPGIALSPPVQAALPALAHAVQTAIEDGQKRMQPCTRPVSSAG